MSIGTFFTVLVLAAASYRITRFIVLDAILEQPRTAFHDWLNEDASKRVRFYVYTLTSCTWCTGFWISLLVYWIYIWTPIWYWTRLDFIAAIATAGIQGFLHSIEPDES